MNPAAETGSTASFSIKHSAGQNNSAPRCIGGGTREVALSAEARLAVCYPTVIVNERNYKTGWESMAHHGRPTLNAAEGKPVEPDDAGEAAAKKLPHSMRSLRRGLTGCGRLDHDGGACEPRGMTTPHLNLRSSCGVSQRPYLAAPVTKEPPMTAGTVFHTIRSGSVSGVVHVAQLPARGQAGGLP